MDHLPLEARNREHCRQMVAMIANRGSNFDQPDGYPAVLTVKTSSDLPVN
jgi:hypothetical protein